MLYHPNCKLYIATEGNTNDMSGNGNTMTNAGVTYTAGKFGKCAIYSSSGSKTTCSSSGFDYTNKDFSVAMWIMHDTSNTHNAVFSLGSSTGSYFTPFLIRVRSSNVDKIKIDRSNSGGTDWGTSLTGTATLGYSSWYHFVYTYKHSTTTGTIYLNGVVDTQSSSDNPIVYYNSARNVVIGAEVSQSGDLGLNGKIEKFSLWDKCLSFGDVKRMYVGLMPFGE